MLFIPGMTKLKEEKKRCDGKVSVAIVPGFSLWSLIIINVKKRDTFFKFQDNLMNNKMR